MAQACQDFELCLSLSARLGYSPSKELVKPKDQGLAITTLARREESQCTALLSWLRQQPFSTIRIKDPWFTSILRQMFRRKVTQGEVIFKYREEDAKTVSWRLEDQFYSRIRTGAQALEPSIALELAAELHLEKALRLCDSEMYLDTLTVESGVLGEIDLFLDLMHSISGGKAFKSPCRAHFDCKTHLWYFESPSWLFSTFNSLARWAGAWLERGVWMQYWRCNGLDPRAEERGKFVWEAEASLLYDLRELRECWGDIKVTLRNRLVEEAIDRGLEYLHKSPKPFLLSGPLYSFAGRTQPSGTGYEQSQGLVAYYNQADSLHELRDRLESGPVLYLDLLLSSSLDRALSLLDYIARSLAVDIRNLLSRHWAEELLMEQSIPRRNKPKRHKKARKMSDISSTSASLSSYEEEDVTALCSGVLWRVVEEAWLACTVELPRPSGQWPFIKKQESEVKRRRKKKKPAKKADFVPSLHLQIDAFLSSIQAQLVQQQPCERFLMDRIRSAVSELFPQGTVSRFGSRASGLALASSDLDVAVGGAAECYTLPALYTLNSRLQTESWVVSVTVLDSASVPLIKLRTAAMEETIPVDISFEVGGMAGVRKERLRHQQRICGQFASIRPTLLVLKQLVLSQGLSQAYEGYLSSYTLFIWTTAYAQFTNESDSGKLLTGFLDYFSTRFDPKSVYIDINSEW